MVEEEEVLTSFTNLSSPVEAPAGASDQLGTPQRRKTCSGCERPATVCLCAALPSPPISTNTQIVILHHPHEARHKLNTVPALSKCLSNSRTLVGRRLRPGSSPLLDSLHASSLRYPNQPPRAIYLFPGTPASPAVPIGQLESSGLITPPLTGNLVLILFDGTWKHAKEMVSASMEFLVKFSIRVCLECDDGVEGGSMYDSDLILRKEPFGGCVSTMEAVARALRVLEPSGVEIEGRLVEVLKTMVSLQARNLKPVNPRPRLAKKTVKKAIL